MARRWRITRHITARVFWFFRTVRFSVSLADAFEAFGFVFEPFFSDIPFVTFNISTIFWWRWRAIAISLLTTTTAFSYSPSAFSSAVFDNGWA